MAFLLKKRNNNKCGNIIVWIILIVLSVIFSLFLALPATKEWIKLRSSITKLKEENLNYENDIARKKLKLSSIEKEFNRIAKDFLKEEKLLFPESVNINNIAKVIELYSIQYSLIDENSKFELNSISFSKLEGDNYTKLSASMSITSSEKSLKDFIYFIQNNKLPEKLLSAQNSQSSILRDDISTIKFLRDNILPIANIESITSTKDEENVGSSLGMLKTDIQINFFSQKTAHE